MITDMNMNKLHMIFTQLTFIYFSSCLREYSGWKDPQQVQSYKWSSGMLLVIWGCYYDDNCETDIFLMSNIQCSTDQPWGEVLNF